MENGEVAPMSPEPPEVEHERTESRGSDRADEMGTGMAGLFKTCSGRGDAKRRASHDVEQIPKMARDLGGSFPACKTERNKAMTANVSAIYSSPRVP